jgi:pimeloyl-ACP methyl ester carboxylesterase
MDANLTRRHAIGLVAAAPALFSAPARAKTRGVDETGFVRIGEIDQWIGIQGEDARNPVILYLHGGPAEAQSPFLKQFLPWETDFTVVNWDQRGSGRTYGRNGPTTPGMSTPDLAFDRLCLDALEVVDYVRKRLSKKKLILVGQSWGAELGLHVVKRWPERFYAFVGTGQPVSWNLKIEAQEHWAKAQATAAGDNETLKALGDTASLPMTDRTRMNASRKYILSASDLAYVKMMGTFIGFPSTPSPGDAADWVAGGEFTSAKLSPVETSLDARKLGLDISIPFFVIQGREDHIAPFDVAQAYVAEVRSPKKAFIPIAGGHYACFTNPAEFVEALRRHVRPLAK